MSHAALPDTAGRTIAVRRARWWLALVAALVLGAIVLANISQPPDRPLDPSSVGPDGSKALSRLLAGYGAPVHTVSSLADATAASAGAGAGTGTGTTGKPGTAVVVTAPDDYSAAQLRALASAARPLVLLRPGTAALRAVLPGATVDPATDPTVDPAIGSPSAPLSTEPDCADPGARAAGRLDVPPNAVGYRYPARCYGGLLVVTPRVVLLGSADVVRNDQLSATGVAALDVNAITADRTVASVTWLLPGADARAERTASVWDLFPAGAQRAFWWLLAVGGLLALCCARRLGGVVSEPLPVVVRSIEAVEGHGRLYLRAGARDRAAAALRAAAAARLTGALGLARGTSVTGVGVGAAPLAGLAPAEVMAVLAGPPPVDDAGLVDLARRLDALEDAVNARIGT